MFLTSDWCGFLRLWVWKNREVKCHSHPIMSSSSLDSVCMCVCSEVHILSFLVLAGRDPVCAVCSEGVGSSVPPPLRVK